MCAVYMRELSSVIQASPLIPYSHAIPEGIGLVHIRERRQLSQVLWEMRAEWKDGVPLHPVVEGKQQQGPLKEGKEGERSLPGMESCTEWNPWV